MVIINTPPVKTKTGTPITLAQAKAHLNIDTTFTADDELISDLIDTVIEIAEGDINADILTTANVLTYDLEDNGIGSLYRINSAPCSAVSKIEYYNGSAWVTIASSEYVVAYGWHWVEIEFSTTYAADQLRFTFATGYADASVPKGLRQACLIKLSDLYDTERQGYNSTAIVKNNAYTSLISKHIRNYYYVGG